MMTSVRYEYGILEFSSKNRIQTNGVMFRPFLHGQKSVIRCNKPRSTDVWAKIEKRQEPDKEPEQHLVEILGDVGKIEVEAEVLRLHYNITPCRYPDVPPLPQLDPLPSSDVLYETAITVDNEYTLDRDDAISLVFHSDNRYTIGIHITDTTRLPIGLLSWARQRGASAYWSSLDGKYYTKPMLPPVLAHQQFSLNKNTVHPCISLYLEYDADHQLEKTYYKRTSIKIQDNLSYVGFQNDPAYVKWIENFKIITGKEDTEDMIAWLMIQYNFYFSEMLVNKPGILLRTQENINTAAKYTLTILSSLQDLIHASMDYRLYGHFTSPIRRYADMNNQFVLFDMLEHTEHELDKNTVDELNTRIAELNYFHYHDTIINLAYMYKKSPAILDIQIKVSENGRFALIQLPEKRVKIPLYDSYYSEPLSDVLKTSDHGTKHRIELFGIHKHGKAQLRIRFQKTYYPKQAIIQVKEKATEIIPISKIVHDAKAPIFNESLARIESVAGYNLDSFQQQALQTMLDGYDVLGMAPTGSGKTILALMAILLQALDKNQRAIFTSPIKALSNQKYSEFMQWFNRLGAEYTNRITLLTGDIQARATPAGGDGRGELLIMTSEILANKLESSRTNQRLDPDLENVSIVVMDEVHYINDNERGHVWETTLMTLPQNIQIVALSATLNEPQRFCDWMSKRKPTKIVQRFDRHVPLYIGGYDEDDMFFSFFSTHAEHKVLATSDYDRLYHSSVVLNRMVSSPNELPEGVANLVNILENDAKLPAIVFFMNRARCVQCAEAINRNLLLGSQVRKKRGKDDFEYDRLLYEHQEKSIDIKNRQQAMYRKYLLPFKDMLEQIPGFYEFKQMLDKGVAYHHAGMIPILREYVEILFQEKLLKIVFATETLGVGINMPARTTVFTQLDKPSGKDSFRPLRPDEFWQMAGRAGRRGMDTQGYVIYYPFEKTAPSNDMKTMLVGQLPSAVSQLKIDKLFVLRHLKDNAILSKTLLQHQIEKRITALRKELDKLPTYTPSLLEDMKQYQQLKEKLQMRGFVKLTPKQRQQYEQDMKKISEKHTNFEKLMTQYTENHKLENEISCNESALTTTWDECMKWLIEHDYATSSCDLTIKGKTATQMCDGSPLIRANILCGGHLKGLTFEEIVTWLAFFSEPVRIRKDAPKWQSLSDNLEDLYDASDKLTEELNESVSWASGAIMNMWCSKKDIHLICQYIEPSQFGVFVKMVLRVITYIDEMKPILLSLQEYEIYNTLENYHDRLLCGVVTNQSLYVHANHSS